MMNSQAPDLDVQPERIFIESSLPDTVALAARHRERLEFELKEIEAKWPFEDRILVWLADHWLDDVRRFHADAGPDMSEQFTRQQLHHLDDQYCDKLRAWLKANA